MLGARPVKTDAYDTPTYSVAAYFIARADACNKIKLNKVGCNFVLFCFTAGLCYFILFYM